MKVNQSIEAYCETGFYVPLQSDSYTVQKTGSLFHVVNPDGVIIGECSTRHAAITYANKQNTANYLKLVS